MFRGSASAIVLVYLFFSSMLQLAVSSQSTGWKASKLSARDVQHSRHHLTSHHNMARSFQSNLRQRADVPELLDPDDRLHRFYARSTNQRRQNLTFEFDRHDGRSYVRFILAGSVVDGKDSKPVVISQKDCRSYENDGADKYNAQGLRTNVLMEDPEIARPCQTFFAREATPSGFNPVNKQDQDRTNALIAVTVSGNTARNLGWNLTQAVTTEPKTPANITWIDSVDPDDPDNQLLVSCKAWWYQTEVYPVAPQYYGLSCKLQIPRPDKEGEYDCIGSDGSNWEDLQAGPKPLKFSKCKKDDDDSQIWHIQSVAQEWPNYYPHNTDATKNMLDPKRNPQDTFKACTLKAVCQF